MFKVSCLLPKLSDKTKIPPKTMVITHKNGRDVVCDEFIGSYVVRPSLIETIMGLLRSTTRKG